MSRLIMRRVERRNFGHSPNSRTASKRAKMFSRGVSSWMLCAGATIYPPLLPRIFDFLLTSFFTCCGIAVGKSFCKSIPPKNVREFP